MHSVLRHLLPLVLLAGCAPVADPDAVGGGGSADTTPLAQFGYELDGAALKTMGLRTSCATEDGSDGGGASGLPSCFTHRSRIA